MSDALAQARDLFLQGNEHAQSGRLAQAEQAYRQALALAPGRPSILANLGITLWHQDRQAEALGPLQQTLQADPEQPEAWLALGLSAEALGQWELAAQALSEGTRRHPQAAAPPPRYRCRRRVLPPLPPLLLLALPLLLLLLSLGCACG